MIERISDLPADIIGIRAIGEFSIDDYTAVIEPELERLDVSNSQLRLILHLGEQFTGFGEGAWGDLTNEIRHTHFHRGAVVTDDGAIRTGLNLMKWVLHGHVRTFQNDEYDKAVDWVSE